MPAIQLDDQLWQEFLQLCNQLGIQDPELFLTQWLRQRLKSEQQAEGRYQLITNAIVTDLEGQVLLTGNQYDRQGPLVWGLPGGSLELGENIQQALVRELFEETGLEANSVGQLVSVSQIYVGPHATSLLVFTYKVNQWQGTLSTRNETPGGLVRKLEFLRVDAACDLLPPSVAIPLQDYLSAPDQPTRLYWKEDPDPQAIRRVDQG
jgi:ADP-ribose pyrophosphatase YjhB (NUDIX family)